MKKIFLNSNLIKTLSSVLSRPAFELRAATSIKPTTWHSIMKYPDAITVQQLLAIANGLCIPVSRFFSTHDTTYIGSREEYVTFHYKECYYDSEKMRSIINSIPDSDFQKVITADGTSRQRLRDSLFAITRTPLKRFLTACENFDIDPFTVLIDPNHEMEYNNKQKIITQNIPEQKASNTAYTLHEDIATLHKQIIQLNCLIADLTLKYEQLLNRQARLENSK